jgi:predicted amidophosphoribosyltransferase
MIIPSWEGDTCPQCAGNVDADMEFCEECGTRLRSTAEQRQIYDDQGEEASLSAISFIIPLQNLPTMRFSGLEIGFR